LVDKGNLEAAIERVVCPQAFREDFGIIENVNSGRRALHDCLQIFPDYCSSISYYAAGKNYSFVYDGTKMTAGRLKIPFALDKWIKATYYIFHAVNPDLEAIRGGVLLMCECEGFEFRKHHGMRTFVEIWTKLGLVYPINIKQTKHSHTGVIVQSLLSMGKSVVSDEISRSFETGNVCEIGRLSDLYNPRRNDSWIDFHLSFRSIIETKPFFLFQVNGDF
jgi:hypothetical protein